MINQNKLSITIGIPAHDEEKNIGALLHALPLQRGDNFVVEKILVVLDGCSDQTEVIVKELALINNKIILLADGKRLGKTARLNQIYHLNESEILITLDADIGLANESVLAELIKPFADLEVAVVAGNDRPLPGRTFIEKINIIRDAWWFEARKDFNNGNNIYNSSGRCFALRKRFTKNFKFKPDTLHDQEIIFLETMQQRKKFAFAEQAVFYYRESANWSELVIRAQRYQHKGNADAYNYSFYPQQLPKLPIGNKIRAVAKHFLKQPLYTAISLFFAIAMKVILLKKNDNIIHRQGLWQMSGSTKRLY